jgi:excinuclease UvrABC nuclease subunit
MNEIKNLSPAREKEPVDWKKVRTQLIIGLVVIGMFYCTSIYLTEQAKVWNSKHGFQSPVILRSPIYDKQTKQDEPMTQVIVKPVEAKAPFCYDAISCIRDVGESVGVTNKEIITMINIAKKESTMNPLAKNPKSTAKGLFQILDGTWKHYECTGDVLNFEDNTKCAYRILKGYNKIKGQGFGAWEVCKTSVDCN